MKDLAEAYLRARMKQKEKENEAGRKKRHPASQPQRPDNPYVYGEIPDAWEPRHRPDVEEIARSNRAKKRRLERLREQRKKRHAERETAQVVEEEPDTEEEERERFYVEEEQTRRRMKKRKRRTVPMSISVSEEEEELLRAYVAQMDTTFSAWARRVLFRAMGRKPPARPK